jgi:hypothetical protein
VVGLALWAKHRQLMAATAATVWPAVLAAHQFLGEVGEEVVKAQRAGPVEQVARVEAATAVEEPVR